MVKFLLAFLLTFSLTAEAQFSYHGRRMHPVASQLLVATDSTANAAEYTTAAFTAGAFRLLLCLATTTDTVLPDAHSITSLHGTWTQIGVTNFKSVAVPLYKISLWRLMVTNGTVSSTLTNKFTLAATGSGLAVMEWAGINSRGEGGSAAVTNIVMNALDATANPTVTLAAIGDPRNGVFGGESDDEADVMAPEANWIEDFQLTHNNPFMTFYGTHRNNTVDNTVTITGTAGLRDFGIIGAEIKVQY